MDPIEELNKAARPLMAKGKDLAVEMQMASMMGLPVEMIRPVQAAGVENMVELARLTRAGATALSDELSEEELASFFMDWPEGVTAETILAEIRAEEDAEEAAWMAAQATKEEV